MLNTTNFKGCVTSEEIVKTKNGCKKVIKKYTLLTEFGDKIKVFVETDVRKGNKVKEYDIDVALW